VYSSLLDWLEAHPVVVDLLKWIAVGVLAWFGGAFGYLRRRFRRPLVEVLDVASRCRYEHQKERDGQTNVVRAAFLLRIGVSNCTHEPIYLKTFSMAYKCGVAFRRYHNRIGPCSLPNLPRQAVGDGVKYLSVWLTRFPETTDGLLAESRLEAKDYREGYMLFISHTHGSWNPIIENGHISVRVCITTTDGTRLRAKGKVRVLDDPAVLEEMVPDLGTLLEQQQSWNIPG
jgi:hypothetical protein